MHVIASAGLLATALGVAGCGATGLDWVGEPEAPGASADARDVALSEPLPAGAANRAVEAAPVLDASPEHRRLARTLTLGGEAAPPAAAGAQPAPSAGSERGTTVVINNYAGNQGYGYPYGVVTTTRAGGGSGVNVTPSSPSSSTIPASNTIQPGQNWTPPPRSGPVFPFHVGPASPWEADRSR